MMLWCLEVTFRFLLYRQSFLGCDLGQDYSFEMRFQQLRVANICNSEHQSKHTIGFRNNSVLGEQNRPCSSLGS